MLDRIPPVKLLLLVLMAGAFSALALETDNYLSWGIDLPDSSEELNDLIQTQIEDVIANTSPKQNLSCEQITFRIANRFKTTPRRKLFENYSEEHMEGNMFPTTPYYLGQSIYRNTSRIYLSKSGLSPNLQASGIYFGVDKLSHFGSTGRRYLKHYLKKMKKGYSAEDAEKSAIRLGLSNEARILGLWPSGVFSYGDMEANYQGFRFYKKLCLDQENSYLAKEGGSWKLAKVPDIRDYVNPYWDETFNHSFLGSGMWTVSSRVIRAEYCPLRNTEHVENRFKLYREMNHKSSSLTYIEELQNSRYYQAPVPSKTQSIDKLCEQ